MTATTKDRTTAVTTEDGAPVREGITLYGASWCGDVARSRRLLDESGVDYAYVDIDQDPAGNRWATAQRGGQRRIPTIWLGPDQPVLFEPSDDALRQALVVGGFRSVDDLTEG